MGNLQINVREKKLPVTKAQFSVLGSRFSVKAEPADHRFGFWSTENREPRTEN